MIVLLPVNHMLTADSLLLCAACFWCWDLCFSCSAKTRKNESLKILGWFVVIWVSLSSKYSIHKAVVFTFIHHYSLLVEWLHKKLRERKKSQKIMQTWKLGCTVSMHFCFFVRTNVCTRQLMITQLHRTFLKMVSPTASLLDLLAMPHTCASIVLAVSSLLVLGNCTLSTLLSLKMKVHWFVQFISNWFVLVLTLFGIVFSCNEVTVISLYK